MKNFWKTIKDIKDSLLKRGWLLIFLTCLITGLILGLLYTLPARSIGVQITVESSQLELGEVLPPWSVNSKADTNVGLQAFKYVAISRLDSLNGKKISDDEATEQARIHPKKPTKSNSSSSFVRLESLSLNGPAHITLQQGSNYIKLLMKDANEKSVHDPLHIYATFDAPNGYWTQPPDDKHQFPISRPVEVTFNSRGEEETEWTFSGKPNNDYLRFNWLDIPVTGSISFREFGNDRSGTGHSTIRSGTIKMPEINEIVQLNPRDFLDITLDKSTPVSVDVASRNNALVSIVTGRVVGLRSGRDAYSIDLMPSWIEALASESRLVIALTVASSLATLLVTAASVIVSIKGLKSEKTDPKQ